MKTIWIELDHTTYPVYLGTNIITKLSDLLPHQEEVLIITDQVVERHHLHKLTSVLKSKYYVYTLSATPEANKTLQDYERLVSFALAHHFTRNLVVIAFGGGAVGDFAGFFAATYKRGVKWLQIPTTLLAHDSSVGGKVALNFGEVKNVLGSFHQPDLVLYDLQFLQTLNQREVLSGFAEIIKHDLLSTGKLIQEVFSLENILSDLNRLESIIYDAIMTKYQYIKSDVYDEKGVRQYLNLGHTLGHGLERHSHLSHGEAILFGLCFDVYLSNPAWSKSLYEHFLKLGYFHDLPCIALEDLVKAMQNDKKNSNDSLTFNSLLSVGQPDMITLSISEFISYYQAFLKEVVA